MGSPDAQDGPASVIQFGIIRDTFDERHWREFACRRPACSVSSAYNTKADCRSSGLWSSLSPDKRNLSTALFPKFKSIASVGHLSVILSSVRDYLRVCGGVGFKLMRPVFQGTGQTSACWRPSLMHSCIARYQRSYKHGQICRLERE